MYHCRPILLDIIKRYTFQIGRTVKTINTMGCNDEQIETQLLKECKSIIPNMTQELYKGQAGRIGIIGGSLDYTGAPYFAAISALKVGCDLSHVFCAKEAAPVIKSYSPELIVHPVLDACNAFDLVLPWLPRLHVLVIGPGLGRDIQIMETVAKIIKYCRDNHEDGKPLVIDADGLFMITEKPEIIKGYPHGVILTPNAIEFSRLAKTVLGKTWSPTPNPDVENVKALAIALGNNITVLHKGASDVIANGSENFKPVKCSTGGSGRRCGGQGDLLSGSLGTFYCWARQKADRDVTGCVTQFSPAVVAAYAACRLTRECNQMAMTKSGRSTLTTDMLKEIHCAFNALFEG